MIGHVTIAHLAGTPPAPKRSLLLDPIQVLAHLAAGGRPRQLALGCYGKVIGEDHPRAKLKDAEVEAIRALRSEGHSYGAIARHYGVSRWTIRDIVVGRRRRERYIMGQVTAKPPRLRKPKPVDQA